MYIICFWLNHYSSYRATGHNTRVNYYSNPNVTFDGKPVGTSLNNNAEVLNRHRFVIAGIGDETGTCNAVAGTHL